MSEETGGRTLGLFGATGVGVGAIVGGGFLALSGVAFAVTGPGAILAFALNGVIALLTAASFAELASGFPQSGGTYTFARKVLSVEAAFSVGWVVWFASIVAAVLYAVGFGFFAALIVREAMGGSIPAWAGGGRLESGLALLAVAAYAAELSWRRASGGLTANIGKVIVFGVLIAGGVWVLFRTPGSEISNRLTPFFSGGLGGLIQAMGFTFIALQGFDLIAAVGGQVKNPERNIPKAMFISLGIALGIYLPLLFLVATVGMSSGANVSAASAADPEAIVALAAKNYLGAFGYWMVLVGAVLSMLSALRANLQASSRFAHAMAEDRTLPDVLGRLTEKRKTPVPAVLLSAGIIGILIIALRDVAAAGAASSLIFLVSFTIVHVISILARRRGQLPAFRAPLFPLIPVIGAVACLSLGVFQAVAVPRAGIIGLSWLAAGIVLFLALFAKRARVFDAGAQALDPQAVKLRGKSPLILLPLSNPRNANALVTLAAALAPRPGRVLILTVVIRPEEIRPELQKERWKNAQSILGEALSASLAADFTPETLTTIARDAFQEIGNVARNHRCESVLLGMSEIGEDDGRTPLDTLADSLDTNIVVLRSEPGWQVSSVKRILIPLGGLGGYEELRARMLGALFRRGNLEVTYLRVMPEAATETEVLRARKRMLLIGRDEVPGPFEAVVEKGGAPVDHIVRYAESCDLLLMGLQKPGRRRQAFGAFTREVARKTDRPLLLIRHPRRGNR